MLRETDFEALAPGATPAAAPAGAARVLLAEPPSDPQRHFLFVTAPFGPFSARLARALRQEGARCSRVLLGGGDLLDWGLAHAIPYRGGFAEWGEWIDQRFAEARVTDLILHGDSHPYGRVAAQAARARGLRVHVFEQGYFRPNWITLERDGVNASSPIPREPSYFRQLADVTPESPVVPVGRITPAAVRRIVRYHLWQYLLRPAFPHFRSPYRDPAWRQAVGHVRRYGREMMRKRKRAVARTAVFDGGGDVFLALLQRPGDSQLTRHSRYSSVRDFIHEVLCSFARHAPADARILFKPHPLDQGLENHEATVTSVARELSVSARVFFTDGGHLPTLIRASTAVVSVNSTAGLNAVLLGKPTLNLGGAIYEMAGITHQGGLDSFWTAPEAPDPNLVRCYTRVMLAQTQINGAFSTRSGIELAVGEAARRLLND